jgi:hypothetical protein
MILSVVAKSTGVNVASVLERDIVLDGTPLRVPDAPRELAPNERGG